MTNWLSLLIVALIAIVVFLVLYATARLAWRYVGPAAIRVVEWMERRRWL